MSPSRPIVRWHGGKWRLAPWIISHFPPHRVYVEPFLGAGSVLIRKARSEVEVGNDLYGRIVNVFRVLRDPELAGKLIYGLKLTPYAEEKYRDCRPVSGDPVEDARRMLVLGYQGHGSVAACGGRLSGWRRGVRDAKSNSAKEWECIWRHVDSWAARLRGVYLENTTAIGAMMRWDSPGTLHYVDPPYVAETRKQGMVSYKHEMSEEDHRELAECLNGLRGMVILSGYPSSLYDELYGDWTRVSRAALADKGISSTECLWLKNIAGVDMFQEKSLEEASIKVG